ncbi:MAG TPA: HNH endonuclease [Armatimonadota bacterium]|nr:HNH endonuclease [Armatimonadota bacterium]
MDGEVLVLNSDFEPLNVCNVRRAIALVHLGKAEVLHIDQRSIRSYLGEWPSPSVLKLRHHVRRPMPQLRLSRRSVFARDDYQCQYCGLTGRELTIDHVIPKRLGGGATWENLVACCRRCNAKKGDKALSHTGMRLRNEPKRPRYVPYISLAKYVAGQKNEVWRMYLPPMPGSPEMKSA